MQQGASTQELLPVIQADRERLKKQFGLALEAIEAIADGEGTAQVIAQQTLDEITRVGMEAIALEREEAPEPTEPAGVAGLVERLREGADNLAEEYVQRINEIARDIGKRWDGGEIQIRETIFEAIRRGSALGRAFQTLHTPPLLEPFAAMPCETKGAEDLEPGCCRTCRARAALQAIKGAEQ